MSKTTSNPSRVIASYLRKNNNPPLGFVLVHLLKLVKDEEISLEECIIISHDGKVNVTIKELISKIQTNMHFTQEMNALEQGAKYQLISFKDVPQCKIFS